MTALAARTGRSRDVGSARARKSRIRSGCRGRGAAGRRRAVASPSRSSGWSDIGPGWWGKFSEENDRGLLGPKSGELAIKPGKWNFYEIEAVGGKVRTFLNGKLRVDLDDPARAGRGVFTFQLHEEGPTEVQFKDIRLDVNPKIKESVSARPLGSR